MKEPRFAGFSRFRFDRFSEFAAFGSVCVLLVIAAWSPKPEARSLIPDAQSPTVTFTKDVAPIVFDRCVGCHQPNGVAPFSLLTYESARQHATQIAALTRARVMPPWRAESDFGSFVGQHPLSDTEIATFDRWVKDGAQEGDARALPQAPLVSEGWQLGKPDIIVTPSSPYALRADGTDVFRIFVISLPVNTPRYVRGLEFHPGNARVVHHANIRIDRTRASRRLDDEDPDPGYEGLIANSAMYPDGHFLGWTPGQIAPLLPKGLAWRLDPGTDLVVELHMQPSGRSESVQPSIGLYFTNDPPELTPTMLRLGKQSIDIAAGDARYTITDSFVLPVDVEVEAVQPHAHQRAREVTSTVTLPDGTTTTLIRVPDWDFRWQHVYRFTTPFKLPKGTTLAMRWVYDNSDANVRNPTQPPRRVFWGQRSADEMGDLWIQVLTKDHHDLDVLADAFNPKMMAEDVLGYEREIERTPSSIALHDSVALIYLKLGRAADAVRHFDASQKLQPDVPSAHFNLAFALTVSGKLDGAEGEYRRAITLKPDYAQAHNNLGAVLLQLGRVDEAMRQGEDAVRVDPKYAEGHGNLARAYAAAGRLSDAVREIDAAMKLSPPEPLASVLRQQLDSYRRELK